MSAGRTELAITLGEPAGIGPEVTVAALSEPDVAAAGCGFLLFGPEQRFEQAARALEGAGRDTSLYRKALAEGRVRFRTIPLSGRSRPGVPAPEDEPVVVESIRAAVQAARDGVVSAVVTAPIDKRALFHRGHAGWGHTEYIAHLLGASTPTMVLMSRPNPRALPLRVALVTNHVQLSRVREAFSAELLEARAHVLREGLGQLGIPHPRLAVAGFNPHCGEGGELGTEDEQIVRPAVGRLRQAGLDIRGPISADTVFVRAIAGDFDAVLALYHDQGMIPVKVYGFGHGVNWTLGIPIVRTSPDHGTAYDIAGTGRAESASMSEAIALAAALARR
jgi:4-hydroxythreonine-4-phosphate dehydrogenase